MWRKTEDFEKITWNKQDIVCLNKEFGGLGIRIIKEFNVAPLGKWCWRLRGKR